LSTKTCIDLCSGLGGFSAAFEDDPTWDVVTVDINPAFDPDIVADVMILVPSDDRLPNDPDVVLASPPCTKFSRAGNHDAWDDREPVNDDARDAIAFAHHVAGLVKGLNPEYWVIENPEGRLRYKHGFGSPDAEITLCQYGTEYQKPTDLWGRLPPGFSASQCARGGDCHENCGTDDNTTGLMDVSGSAERAKMPYDLGQELLDAIDATSAQQPITDVPPAPGHTDVANTY